MLVYRSVILQGVGWSCCWFHHLSSAQTFSPCEPCGSTKSWLIWRHTAYGLCQRWVLHINQKPGWFAKKSFLKFLDIKFITTVYQPWNHKQISFWFKRMQSATCWQRLSFSAPRFSSQTSNQVNWHYGRKLRKVKVKHFLNFSSQPRPFQHFTLKTPAATASSRKLLWLGFELISGFNPGLIDQGVSSGNSTNSFALKKKMPLLTSIYWKQKKKTCFISPFGDIKKTVRKATRVQFSKLISGSFQN